MDTFALLIPLAELLGPTLVAILTVPAMAGLKQVVAWIDTLPAPVQQVLVVLISAGLTWLGSTLGLALPADLALFADADVSALIAAGMAMAIHAGKKARGG